MLQTYMAKCSRDNSTRMSKRHLHSIFFEDVTLDFPLKTCSTKLPFPSFSISENDTIIHSVTQTQTKESSLTSLSFPHCHMQYASKFCWLYLQVYADFAADTSTGAILTQTTTISVLIALPVPCLASRVKSQPKCQKVVLKPKQNTLFPCLKHSSGF